MSVRVFDENKEKKKARTTSDMCVPPTYLLCYHATLLLHVDFLLILLKYHEGCGGGYLGTKYIDIVIVYAHHVFFVYVLLGFRFEDGPLYTATEKPLCDSSREHQSIVDLQD